MDRMRLLAAAVFLIMAAAGTELRAEIMVEVRNETGGKAFICFSYHDVISETRITRGWWEVKAFSTRVIRVNTDQADLMWYAYSERGLAWGGDEDDPESVRRHVVQENFFVKEGWKPRGYKHMKVFMKPARTYDKRLNVKLSPRNNNAPSPPKYDEP